MRKQFANLRAMASLIAVGSLLAAGCGGTKNKVVDVQGKISFQDGTKLPPGTRLVFNPAGGGAGAAFGIAADDGSFQVEHVTGRTGAEIGKYTVLLAAPEDDGALFFKVVPKEYYEDGVLAADVREGMGPLELKVKPNKKPQKANGRG